MISVIVMTLGVFTLAFQYMMQETIFWILPVALFCILIGLGGDYVIFMMSRVREEINKGKSDEDAILEAVQSTGPVIMLCGAVMGTAFASMIASSMVLMKEVGFVVSFGIVLDATVMIWVIIPAIMMAFKKYNWWFPGKRKAMEVTVPAEKE
jgi:RND superfamily putative drug exporter